MVPLKLFQRKMMEITISLSNYAADIGKEIESVCEYDLFDLEELIV